MEPSNSDQGGYSSTNNSTTATPAAPFVLGPKRPHKRTFQTLLTTSKIRHLKKRDGEPLWRGDIQYDFLHEIFYNTQAVFTNAYTHEKNQTFADIYIDAMARSSKCSKILGEKLVGDRAAAQSIAMVCLLVNIGRMNTTLNFFPEMKAQLRTYHPIPSLQSHDTADYKQLQDAPRLKSILKGAAEDREEPTSLEELSASKESPPTNPINLVFLMSSHWKEVSELMEADTGFFDLIMDNSKSSKSRGRVFLWLMWAYLESDFSNEQLAKNPFGDGIARPPRLVRLTYAEFTKENIDPPSEISFGNQMTLLRLTYLEGPIINILNEGESNRGTPQPNTHLIANTSSAIAAVNVEPKGLPKARTAYARRVQDEYVKLLGEKRKRRRTKRRTRGGQSMSTVWSRISDLDPNYCSDTETYTASAKKIGATTAGLLALGIGHPDDPAGDFGVEALSGAAALRRAARHRWDGKLNQQEQRVE